MKLNFSFYKVLLEYSYHAHLFRMLPLAVFVLQQQSWVVVTETIWLARPKYHCLALGRKPSPAPVHSCWPYLFDLEQYIISINEQKISSGNHNVELNVKVQYELHLTYTMKAL